jgi:hypothetical protein
LWRSLWANPVLLVGPDLHVSLGCVPFRTDVLAQARDAGNPCREV